jgi:Ca2+-binding EF-hand superfamily protein
MPPHRRASTDAAILKERFKALDTNHSGCLDFDEFKALLLQGNPNFALREMQQIFNLADTNHDGVLVFDEFVDFIHGTSSATVNTGLENKIFQTICGSAANARMDSTEFMKICKQGNLLDRNFAADDVNNIFNKVKASGEKELTAAEFKKALVLVAESKGCTEADIVQAFATAVIPDPGKAPGAPASAFIPPGAGSGGGRKQSKPSGR